MTLRLSCIIIYVKAQSRACEWYRCYRSLGSPFLLNGFILTPEGNFLRGLFSFPYLSTCYNIYVWQPRGTGKRFRGIFPNFINFLFFRVLDPDPEALRVPGVRRDPFDLPKFLLIPDLITPTQAWEGASAPFFFCLHIRPQDHDDAVLIHGVIAVPP